MLKIHITCCKGCTERKSDCHTYCAKYIAEKAETSKNLIIIRERKETDKQLNDYNFQRHCRAVMSYGRNR